MTASEALRLATPLERPDPAGTFAGAATPVEARLASRRERLAEAVRRRGGEDAELVALLDRVDAALSRLERGEWVRCAACDVPIEPEVLDVAPTTFCFECLSPAERRDLERDVGAAARMQRALLPPASQEAAGWEVAWTWEPSGPVSGDHVDLLIPAGEPPGGGLRVLLGDVAGKGIAASLLQSHLHALFRALAPTSESPGELLSRANRQFHGAIGHASHATLVAANLRPGGRLEIANAGHPPPLLASRRGVRPIEGGGVPLGMFADSTYGARTVEVGADEVVLLYTDGLIEAMRNDEEYGIGRAEASLRRHADLPLPDLLAACDRDLRQFLDGRSRGDDLTLLALRRTA